MALSQILVDNERSNRNVPRGLLSELVQRGGDVLYTALRRGVDDASEGIGEIQRNVRRIIRPRDREGGKLGDWIADNSPDVERMVQNAVERVFKLLDLPRRSDVEALNRNLERVAQAVESLNGLPRDTGKSDDAKP